MARLDCDAADGGSRGQIRLVREVWVCSGADGGVHHVPPLSVLLTSGVPLSTGPATHIIPNPASKWRWARRGSRQTALTPQKVAQRWMQKLNLYMGVGAK